MITISIRVDKTTIIGQGESIEREAEHYYCIQKNGEFLQFTAKEIEELKELISKIKI